MRQANCFDNVDYRCLLSLFDYLDDCCFFIKDLTGHIVEANEQLARRYGFFDKTRLIGKTDFELVPYSLAEKYKLDDISVIQEKKPMLRIVEMVADSTAFPQWCTTYKIPMFSKTGEIAGIAGIICNTTSTNLSQLNFDDNILNRILSYIEHNYSQHITVELMAQSFHLSRRSIERLFRYHLGISPYAYIIRVRVLKACDHLLKGKTLAYTADICGFSDLSAFSKSFKAHVGYSPSQYQKMHLLKKPDG